MYLVLHPHKYKDINFENAPTVEEICEALYTHIPSGHHNPSDDVPEAACSIPYK